jgi:DNA-directed RNA polymerase subunit RPC12/RpoP
MDYFCMNCYAKTTLDTHGRCFRCGSEATDIAVRPPATYEGISSAYGLDIDSFDEMIEQEIIRGY